MPNTSRGLATAANSIGAGRGDNVVVNDLENWANVYPWTGLRRRGVEVRIVKGRGGVIHLADVEAAVEIGAARIAGSPGLARRVIPQLHAEMWANVSDSTRFRQRVTEAK